ncbi:MAG: tryptophan--tRNA ligase [candidate division NC10 bacterium]|nr:tryptophan--tRNA ligase [candidate division NC10 bacterium]
MQKKRVVSGMRPSGKLHLGHLVGALDNWKKLQVSHHCYFFVADWHALTSEYADTGEIREYVREIVIDWLSVGIDPEQATLFVQSRIPEHAELHLLLSMITPLSWLERNPTYKEQLQEITSRDLSTYGFLGYPVLQAADILIYKANYVPVGIDQMPHIELTREIARRFNSLYGETLVIPEGMLTEFPKIPGLDGRKMSKSYQNYILVSDTPSEIRAKVRPMVTDPARVRRNDPGNPDLCPVFDLHKVFTPAPEHPALIQGCRSAGIGCLDCKEVLLGHLIGSIKEAHQRRQELAKDPQRIEEILQEGSLRARSEAARTLSQVKEAMRMAGA